MKIGIDDVFDQIINIRINDPSVRVLKDIRLDLKKDYDYDISRSYPDAYDYLCDCLLMDQENAGSQKLLDLFLVHQYLCFCYFSRDMVECLAEDSDHLEATIRIVKECFWCCRAVGAFQACTEQYEILRNSSLWNKLNSMEQMQVMKEAAKSYRNTGDFYNALNLYYECLLANPQQDWVQRVELLLKIGKVYRNYLMQIELARFYVEEAYLILEENRTQAFEGKKERRYAVICLDTLGQIYRDEQDFEKAKAFFKRSKELYGEKGGRAHVHEVLMKYQENDKDADVELRKDIAVLTAVIAELEGNPAEEIGMGIRSIQLGGLKFADSSRENGDAYREIFRGRDIAYRYNDVKTIIRSYMEEAHFLIEEKKYAECIEVSEVAIKIAADNKQMVLENEIIKNIIELSNVKPDVIDSVTKIELIKRRKDIYKKLVEFAKFSIEIVQQGDSLFSKDKLIDMYGIVLDDFEHISDELGAIIEILNIEIDRINQKYLAYLDTEIKGFTYKSILHKFKNDLPDKTTIIKLKRLIEGISTIQPEEKSILHKHLETFENIIMHIKQSANEALKESEYEKRWCFLHKLIQTGIQKFVYLKPQYKKIIQCVHMEHNVEILVQSTLFESTISEILKNAFDFVESLSVPEKMEDVFQFMIDLKVAEKRVVVLDFYSIFWDSKIAGIAGESMKNGLEYRMSTKETGSRYGFYSMKFLFEELMGGKIQLLREENKAGISIHLPINLVSLRFQERDKGYGIYRKSHKV